MNPEQKLLERAAMEIRTLRRHNEIMAAKLEVFDGMMQILNSQAAQRGGGLMSPDLVFEIDKHLQETAKSD